MGFHSADKPGEACRQSTSFDRGQEIEQVRVLVAEVLANPSCDVLALRGKAQLVIASVGGLPFSGQPATGLHAGGKPADRALLQSKAAGQVLLR